MRASMQAGCRRGGATARSTASTLVTFIVVVSALVVSPAGTASAAQVGFRAHSFAGFNAGQAMTGEKPESKLWFHNGSWWAVMLSPARGGAHTIHRLDGTTWTDTGVVVDTRPKSREDVLLAGSDLYVVSRTTNGKPNKLRKFSFVNGTYRLASGFPVTVPGAGAETITLARDSVGTLWVSYELGQRILVAHSRGSDTSWSAPLVVPVPEASGVRDDDISAIISFADASGSAIGVFWSNQNTQKDYFAVHRDGAPDTAWTVETALSGAKEADDHINLKTAEGQVFAAVKTSKTVSSDPLIRLLVRSPTGSWSKHPVALVREANTRPITMLEIDTSTREVYVFFSFGGATSPEGIAYKKSSISNINFPSTATIFIAGPNNEAINDATSMKANADDRSGIVVMASDVSSYWWNRL
jgi:hypothetical protein